jgi:ubiquinone/menaquinone biosynthesis C-methylase UbiE
MSAYSIPGTVLMANVWWYAFYVLRPAQAMKQFGWYRSRSDIGVLPAAIPPRKRGGGRYYSRKFKKPVLLETAPESYELVEDFDAISSTYQQAVEPFSRPVFEEVSRTLRPLAPKNSRILDCSCGPGTELQLLAEMFPDGEVVGSDLAARMVLTAAEAAARRELDNVAFFQADVARLPEHFGGRFDFVYCSLAFHHYPDGAGAVREMYRCLRPAGHAVVVDAGPWWMKMLASPMAKWGDPGWITFRTGDEFKQVFTAAGFSSFYWTEVLPGIGLSIATK